MEGADESRARKLEEFQRQIGAQNQEQSQMQQQLEAFEALVRNYLNKEALIRYGTLKTAYPDRAAHLVLVIGNAVQSGNLKEKLTDSQLKEILRRIAPNKRETR